MCVMSMIMDHFGDKWDDLLKKQKPPEPVYVPVPFVVPPPPPITPEEVAEFRRLLERAREYDKRNNEPDCELEEKRERIRALAKELGVDVEFIESPKK